MVFVIIHKASVCEDFAFIFSEIAEIQVDGNAFAGAGDHLCIGLFRAAEDGFADAGNEDIVAGLVLEGSIRVDGEGNDAPVDAVAALALRGVLVADVCISAQHFLAGCSLFAGAAVAGFTGEYA